MPPEKYWELRSADEVKFYLKIIYVYLLNLDKKTHTPLVAESDSRREDKISPINHVKFILDDRLMKDES